MRLRRLSIAEIRAFWRENARLRLLCWATLIGTLCGTLGLLEPLENVARTMRGWAYSQPASGQIAVIGIDEKSVNSVGRWPWDRAKVGELIDKLNAAGVDSIYFDIVFSGTSDPKSDARFIEALKRSPKPVTLAAHYQVDPLSGKRTKVLRRSLGAGQANSAVIDTRMDFWGIVWWLNNGFTSENHTVPSLANALVDNKIPYKQFFIDHSIKIATVPYVSATDLLNGAISKGYLKGRKVVVALASPALGDIHYIPGLGSRPGVYVQILGAETFIRGPLNPIGWTPFLLITLVTVAMSYKRGNANTARHGALLCVILIAPIALGYLRIVADIMPALTALGFIMGSAAIQRARKAGGLVDSKTGLPNFYAMESRIPAQCPLVVVARVHNFADIASSLAPAAQELVVSQLVSRLSLGIGGAQLYQDDNGVFAWTRSSAASPAEEFDGLFAVLNAPIKLAKTTVDLQVTIGVESDTGRPMASRIGSAMFAADEAYKSGQRWRAFDPQWLEDAEWRLSLLGQIDEAIAAGHIWLAYQPQLDLRDNVVTGVEALVRWTHPERGDIAPQDFIGVAEQSGRIERLTGFVLTEAVRAGKSLHDQGFDLTMSVNLSAGLLGSPYIETMILDTVDELAFPRHKLTIEITETYEIIDDEKALAVIDFLRRAGIAISIDDFGTGYSSLEYLKRFDADEVKIDKSFIRSLRGDGRDYQIVMSTLDLARQMKCRTIAEGVENAETLQLLRQIGCHVAQGYHIGRPMRLAALARTLRKDGRKVAA